MNIRVKKQQINTKDIDKMRLKLREREAKSYIMTNENRASAYAGPGIGRKENVIF